MCSQYSERRPTNGCDRLASLRHPSKLQRVSRLGFVTAPTSLNGGEPNFVRFLAVSWAGTLLYRLDNQSTCTAWSENTPQDSVLFRDRVLRRAARADASRATKTPRREMAQSRDAYSKSLQRTCYGCLACLEIA